MTQLSSFVQRTSFLGHIAGNYVSYQYIGISCQIISTKRYLLFCDPETQKWKKKKTLGPGEGGGDIWLIFAGYVPLASQNPYPIIVISVASYSPYL